MNNEYRTAEQGISNVEENTYFIILHSLFDIRYWTPRKKYQKQLSAYVVKPLGKKQKIISPEWATEKDAQHGWDAYFF